MQIVPLTSVASQNFTIQLSNQNCKINLNQKSTGLYFDLFIDNNPIVQSVLCLNRVGLISESYFGFVGQLVFIDTQGTDDPSYQGLGSRFLLTYWTLI
jgi:hypothetical protein